RKEVIQISQLLAKVKEWEISHTPRSANGEADAFSQRRDNKITRLVIGHQPRSSTKLHRRVTQPRNHRDAGSGKLKYRKRCEIRKRNKRDWLIGERKIVGKGASAAKADSLPRSLRGQKRRRVNN
ncbi:hypothetical protein QQP08_002671, partial [Theobroma cacao]